MPSKTKSSKTEANTTEDVFPPVDDYVKHCSNGKQAKKNQYKDLKKRYFSNQERIAFFQKIIDNDDFKSLHREAKKHQKALIKENEDILKNVFKNSSEKKKSDTPPSNWMVFSGLVYRNSKKLVKEIKKIKEIKAVGSPATSILWKGFKSETSEEDRNEESMKSYISKMNDKTYNSLLKKYKTSKKSKKSSKKAKPSS